jgi:hypothetical protein
MGGGDREVRSSGRVLRGALWRQEEPFAVRRCWTLSAVTLLGAATLLAILGLDPADGLPGPDRAPTGRPVPS